MKENNVLNKMYASEVKVELASIDKFRAEFLKIKSGNTAQYTLELQALDKRILKGIQEVGDYQDKIDKTILGLTSLGLTDELKDFQFLRNDIKNDFDELVFIHDKIKGI